MAVLDRMLADLHSHRAHPNRVLYYDHVVVAHLLAFFNPTLRGLRSIEDLFDVPAVRKSFGTSRICRSTLADAQRVFDPELLKPLIHGLRERLGGPSHKRNLEPMVRQLLAVDGSFFSVAPRIAWALFNQRRTGDGGIRKGSVRLHMQFDVLRGTPEEVGLTAGQDSESQHLRERLKADCFYVMDRGFQSYDLLADILAADSDFLVRLRKSAACRVVKHRSLEAADLAANVIEDAEVELGWRNGQTARLPILRRVVIEAAGRNGKVDRIVLLTNCLDLPAEMIARLYRHRWQVELFFRWLKCMAHFEHFFSESREGMTLQVYVTIIGTLLIALQTGTCPSKYDYAMMSCAVLGLISMDDVRQIADKHRAEAERRAARAAQKNQD